MIKAKRGFEMKAVGHTKEPCGKATGEIQVFFERQGTPDD